MSAATPPPRLYYMPRTRSIRVLWLLEEIGQQYDLTEVAGAERRSDEHLRRHPLGRVPALELGDGTTIFESAAICLQLADMNPAAGLIPRLGSSERALVYQWVVFAVAELEAPLFRWIRELGDGTTESQARDRFIAAAGAIDSALDARDSLLGATFTVADVMCASVLQGAHARANCSDPGLTSRPTCNAANHGPPTPGPPQSPTGPARNQMSPSAERQRTEPTAALTAHGAANGLAIRAKRGTRRLRTSCSPLRDPRPRRLPGSRLAFVLARGSHPRPGGWLCPEAAAGRGSRRHRDVTARGGRGSPARSTTRLLLVRSSGLLRVDRDYRIPSVNSGLGVVGEDRAPLLKSRRRGVAPASLRLHKSLAAGDPVVPHFRFPPVALVRRTAAS